MADFASAFSATMQPVGGNGNDPQAPGGETCKGLVRKMNSKLDGRILIFCIALGVGLTAQPAYANKLIIPYAPPVIGKSVEFWEKCRESQKSKSNTLGCQRIRKAEIIADINELDESSQESSSRSTSSAPTSVGGITATSQSSTQTPLASFEQQLLVGFTDFLVNRAKQEARLYLQDELTSNLCDLSNKDISQTNAALPEDNKYYFPRTCQVFDALNKANYSMSSATTMLQAAIRDDFRNYPDTYFEKKYRDEENSEKKKKWLYTRIAAAIYAESRSNRGAAEIIGGLASLPASDCPENLCKHLTHNAKLFWILSENLRQLREHLGEKYGANKTLALRYAVAGTILNNGKSTLDEDERKKLSQRLHDIISTLDAIQNYRLAIQKLEEQATPNQSADLALRLQALLSSVNALIQISSTPDSPDSIKDLQTATELAQAITEENYSKIALTTLAYANDHGSNNRYLPLLAELASAKTSTDMQQVFELAAAPAGSYREKFKSDNLGSITAFAGIARSKEWYNHSGANTQYEWQPFLPVGVQMTKNNIGDSGVFGLFMSVLDLGPLASSRQNTGTVSSSSNVGWAQAFSPGLYITWNPKSAGPLAVGIGIARTTKLVTANTGEQVDATRIQLFIAIDMTLSAFR